MEGSGPARLPARARMALGVQRTVAWMLSPLTAVVVVALLRGWYRLRFEGVRELRRAFRRFRRASREPLLVCANHLTLIDSALVAYVLGRPWWYVVHFSSLPWNLPDRSNFAGTPAKRVLTYVAKCVPIERRGPRQKVSDTLARFAYLLRRGEVGLVFPEGGRSRTGRVDVESAAYGVGRLVKGVQDCRVLCVYLRGDAQEQYGSAPVRGDTIRARIAWLEPKSEHTGVRGSRDIARQITRRLGDLEREHFDAVA